MGSHGQSKASSVYWQGWSSIRANTVFHTELKQCSPQLQPAAQDLIHHPINLDNTLLSCQDQRSAAAF